MNLRNFSLGINTNPAASPGANHVTGSDVVNLRFDEDGYLRPTPGVVTERRTGDRATGIAAAHNHIFYLLASGDLYKLAHDDIGVTKVGDRTALRGKLSIIDDFETFFLITSEANDPGYYYDVESELLQPLTYEQTTRPSSAFADDGAEDSNDANHPGHTIGQFFYVFCEVRENSDVPEGSPASAFHAPPSEAYFQGYVSTDENSDTRWGVYFNGFTYNNDDTTHIYVYRSPKISGYRPQGAQVSNQQPPLTEADAFKYFDESQYFLIGKLQRNVDTDFRDNNEGGKSYFDPTDTTLERWEDEEPARSLAGAYTLDDGLPEGTRSWKHFNGYTFAATGGDLRFSDIDFGVLKHGSFPEINAINAPGDADFAETYNETLVFGDATHFHVLRGYDPYNYQVSQIASIGPVSAYAASILPSGALGFVGEYGFYAYDGGEVKEISSPQLDDFFEGKVAETGFITPLPNGDSIWSVEFLDGTTLTFLLNTERLDAPVWTRLTALVHQSATFRLHGTQEWTFRNDNYWTFKDGDHWTFEDDEETYQQVLFVNNNYAISEYLYNDLESYGSNPWTWKSNKMRGGSENKKVFDRLKIAGYSDNNISVVFDLDIEGESVEKTVTGESLPKKPRKKRIPIKRRAQSCEFTVSGYGDVIIRSLELDSRVVGRV